MADSSGMETALSICLTTTLDGVIHAVMDDDASGPVLLLPR